MCDLHEQYSYCQQMTKCHFWDGRVPRSQYHNYNCRSSPSNEDLTIGRERGCVTETINAHTASSPVIARRICRSITRKWYLRRAYPRATGTTPKASVENCAPMINTA